MHARSMVMDEDALSRLERAAAGRCRTVAALLDDADGFVSKHKGRLARDVPAKHLARTNAARCDAHPELAGPRRREWKVLDAY